VIAAFCAAPVLAEEKKFDVREADRINDVLSRSVGTTVKITLRSGTELSGKLTKAGQQVIVLSELAGKEFYDAAVRIDDISAVVVRMRDR
jgi:hypothetical protein